MAAYIIAEIEVTDPETYEKYKARTPAVIEQYGGRFIVRGGKAELLEGDQQPARLAVIEFSDIAAARRFHELTRIPGDHRAAPSGFEGPLDPGRRGCAGRVSDLARLPG